MGAVLHIEPIRVPVAAAQRGASGDGEHHREQHGGILFGRNDCRCDLLGRSDSFLRRHERHRDALLMRCVAMLTRDLPGALVPREIPGLFRPPDRLAERAAASCRRRATCRHGRGRKSG
jgi:hypothetical protein